MAIVPSGAGEIALAQLGGARIVGTSGTSDSWTSYMANIAAVFALFRAQRRPGGGLTGESRLTVKEATDRALWRHDTSKTKCCPMLRVLLAALLSFASLASVSASTWTEVQTMESTQKWAKITSSSDGTKLAATVNTATGIIWTSWDSGETWTSRANPQNWYGITSSSDGTKLARRLCVECKHLDFDRLWRDVDIQGNHARLEGYHVVK